MKEGKKGNGGGGEVVGGRRKGLGGKGKGKGEGGRAGEDREWEEIGGRGGGGGRGGKSLTNLTQLLCEGDGRETVKEGKDVGKKGEPINFSLA